MSSSVRPLFEAPDEDPVALADCAEINALLRPDGRVSVTFLARLVKRPSGKTDEEARDLANAAFVELMWRSVAKTRRRAIYPFSIVDDGIRLRPATKAHHLYRFLLLTSVHSMASTDRKRANIDPTEVFESICHCVLSSFWRTDPPWSDVVGLGPNLRRPGTFRATVESLCKCIAEGSHWRPGTTAPHGGDGGVDLIAWRHFRDERRGGLVGFAQCKTGQYWRNYLPFRSAGAFFETFTMEAPRIPALPIFMIPNAISNQDWRRETTEPVLLFDRMRLMSYANSVSLEAASEAAKWSQAVLDEQKLAYA